MPDDATDLGPRLRRRRICGGDRRFRLSRRRPLLLAGGASGRLRSLFPLIDGDDTWGNSVYITFFRNHATGKRRSFPDVDNRRAIGLMAGSWWYTFVGNVLGYPGMSAVPYSSFRYESALPWDPQPVPMWQLGYDPEDWKRAADPRVLSTVIREGNFDYATGQVHWSNGPYQLPDSLYLSGKPAFFGDDPWPWVDPTGTTKLHALPARTRFAAMNP